jgi:hypothetical protein
METGPPLPLDPLDDGSTSSSGGGGFLPWHGGS